MKKHLRRMQLVFAGICLLDLGLFSSPFSGACLTGTRGNLVVAGAFGLIVVITDLVLARLRGEP